MSGCEGFTKQHYLARCTGKVVEKGSEIRNVNGIGLGEGIEKEGIKVGKAVLSTEKTLPLCSKSDRRAKTYPARHIKTEGHCLAAMPLRDFKNEQPKRTISPEARPAQISGQRNYIMSMPPMPGCP